MSIENVNVARFAPNVKWDFFCYFETPCAHLFLSVDDNFCQEKFWIWNFCCSMYCLLQLAMQSSSTKLAKIDWKSCKDFKKLTTALLLLLNSFSVFSQSSNFFPIGWISAKWMKGRMLWCSLAVADLTLSHLDANLKCMPRSRRKSALRKTSV